jgi:hypothetical protein
VAQENESDFEIVDDNLKADKDIVMMNTTEKLPALVPKPTKKRNVPTGSFKKAKVAQVETIVNESDFEKDYDNLYKKWHEFLLWQKRKEKIKLCEVCQTTGDLIKKDGQRFHELCYGYCRFIEGTVHRCIICMLDEEEVGPTHVVYELYELSIFDFFYYT